MIILVNEQFHDYEKKKYYIDTDSLDQENPVDLLIMKACKNKSFSQDVFINVDEKRSLGKDSAFWEDPQPTRKKIQKPDKADKVIDLTIYFDC